MNEKESAKLCKSYSKATLADMLQCKCADIDELTTKHAALKVECDAHFNHSNELRKALAERTSSVERLSRQIRTQVDTINAADEAYDERLTYDRAERQEIIATIGVASTVLDALKEKLN
jgi:uncharacterized coiled-coil DUF342 family protein